MYPTLEYECLAVMYPEVVPWADSVTEDGLWGGLWNLDEPFASNYYGKMAIFALEGSKIWIQWSVRVPQLWLYQ
uniref:Transcription factor MYB48-like n=1 Tax=Rhizophora mucronata TaxID=61149 RepID=A0A2P2MWW5_RHIMU